MITRRITRSDEEWPGRVDELEQSVPPQQLFLQGRALATDGHAVAIVGSRRPTAAGIEVARRISGGLAEAGLAVVSGLAVGIDAAAHQAALDAGGYTVAVLGCGLDFDYPKRNVALRRRIAAKGTLVTEYEPGVAPQPANFPARNRIIAGLCEAVVFVEGSARSGGLITARLALDGNRHVFAVPGSVRNPLAAGPNELIRTGQAGLVTNVQQILEEIAPGLVWGDAAADAPLGRAALNQTEARILFFLDDAATTLDQMCDGLDLTFGEVAMALATLEVRNLVLKRRGGYSITDTGARVRRALPLDDDEHSEVGAATGGGQN
ncbi:MAG: DNA-processing protein DprA [Actinomycetota bacterium]|nr:DNA-processing protein DprA [Actinomycetota bacterium]